MARQPDIMYVRAYTYGTAARKLEPARTPKRPGVQPQRQRAVRRDRRKVIRIDPVSLCALAVAAVMLIAMAVGMIELGTIGAQADRMEAYVAELQSENAQLHADYRAGYDLEEVEQKALEMGLVPVEQVEHVTIHVEQPQAEPEQTAWQRFCATLQELFA